MRSLVVVAIAASGVLRTLAGAADAQAAGGDTLAAYARVPLNVSLVPPIAVAGAGRHTIINSGWHLLVGRTARLEGMEAGGLGCIQTESARGVQSAGLFNRVAGPLRGVQLAGILNSATGPVSGLQAAGLVNCADRSASGGQFAGLLNYAGGVLSGVQASAVVNVATTAQVQLCGLANVARNTAEVQASGLVNYAPTATTQLGVVNVARRSTGVQVGFVNWAARQDGVPIGAFSHVAGVPLRLATWGDETGFANAAMISGTRTYYSLLGAGARTADDGPRWWTVTTGFGAHLGRRATFCEIDGLSQMLAQGDDFGNGTNQLTRLRLGVGRQLAARAAALVGISLNLYTSEETDAGDFAPWTVADGWVGKGDNVYIAFWPGVYGGLRF